MRVQGSVRALTATVVAALLLTAGCGRRKPEPDAITLKEAKEMGPVRPTAEMREKMKNRLRQQGTRAPGGN